MADGESNAEVCHLDPEDDPFSCSRCGHPLGLTTKIEGGEYCESCQREHDMNPDMVTCTGCGRYASAERMEPVDVTPPDEYYPKVEYVCWDCSGGEGQ